MANLTPAPSWDGVYQIEKTDVVLGGPGGTANAPGQNLANRTEFLKKSVEKVITDAGLTVNNATTDQLAAAIAGLIATNVPAATDALAGRVELATAAEVQAGTDTTRAVTPAGLAARTASEARTGVVELATAAEVQAGTDAARAVTPVGLASRTATTLRAGLVELADNSETAAGSDGGRAVTPAALKATLQNYAFQSPTVATAAAGDKSTKAASTDFVMSALYRFGLGAGQGTGSTLNTLWSSNDADDVNLSGVYTTSGTTNVPYGTSVLIHAERAFGAGTAALQITPGSVSGNVLYYRLRTGSGATASWGDWTGIASLDSPAFTGTPTVPTPPTADDTTKVANTSWVLANVLGMRGNLGDGVNLDWIKGHGLYFQPSTAGAGSGTNYPVNNAGWLAVLSPGSTATSGIQQIYYAINSSRVFRRTLLTGTWGAWKEDAPTTAATITTQGLVELATGAETWTGTDETRAVTPAAVKAARKYREIAVYNQNATFTVPSGVSWLFVRVIGAGGGGGGCVGGSGGGGGGSGGYSEGVFTVTPGQQIVVTNGVGGAGGAAGARGGDGGTTSFGSLISAVGGHGGEGGSVANAATSGGTPGWGLGGALSTFGGYGGTGSVSGTGFGGASIFGSGGRSGDGGGINGEAAGAGGGGSFRTAGPGGKGAIGLVIVEW